MFFSKRQNLNVAPGPASRTLYTPAFVLLLLIQVSFGFAFSTFFLLPKFLATTLAASPGAIGMVTAMFGFSGILAIPLIGSGIDLIERRVFLRAGSLLMTVSSFGFLLVHSAGALAAALRLAQGLSWAMVFTAALVLTSETAPPERMAEAIGVMGAANLIMNAVAPAMVEPAADRFGYSWVFAAAGFAAIIAYALSLRVDEPGRASRGEALSLVSFLGRPVALMMAPILGSAGVAFGVMFSFHQPFALAVGIHQVRGFFIAYTAGALGVRFGLGRVADRVGRRAVAIAALVLYGVSALGMQNLTFVRFVFFGGLFGFAHGFFFPSFNAMVIEATTPSERGRAMTVSNGYFCIGSAAVLGLGYAAERWGYGAIFVFAGSTTLVGALLLVAWPSVVAPLRSPIEPAKAPTGPRSSRTPD